MTYNDSMNIFQQQIITFVTKMMIILKYSRTVEYWTDLSMISATIIFDDITSTFVHLIKSTFVKISLNHYNFRQYITFFTSKKRINSKSNFKTFVNVFDYLSTRRAEFKFIIISLMMLAFNATSSTFTIKQNNVLFVFFDNVKNA